MSTVSPALLAISMATASILRCEAGPRSSMPPTRRRIALMESSPRRVSAPSRVVRARGGGWM